jgi:tRNA1(Val) A37 N6-methylase TrmN6
MTMDTFSEKVDSQYTASFKRSNGIFFTPEWCAKLLCNEVITSVGKVCDPACGCGVLLVSAARVLHQQGAGTIRHIIENYIWGFDIVEENVQATKSILIQLCNEFQEDTTDMVINVHCRDTLREPIDTYSYIVANPPYVRIQDLNDSNKTLLKEAYKRTCKGNYNMYFAFFEKCYNALCEDGKAGLITPNTFMTSTTGKHLRGYLTEDNKVTKLIDFGKVKVFNASTFTCITVLDRKGTARASFNYVCHEQGNTYNMRYADVPYPMPWNKVPNNGLTSNCKNLKDVVSIRTGIATLCDKVYIVESSGTEHCTTTKDGKVHMVERAVTRPYVKIAAMDTETDVASNEQRIIFPYKTEGGKIEAISEEELQKKYPLCFAYLSSQRHHLDKRSTVPTPWFAWGRVQSMNLHGPRLYIKTFDKQPNFMMDNRYDSLYSNGYALFHSDPTELRVVQKILNSNQMMKFISANSTYLKGDYYCFQKQFIETFPVPVLGNEQKQKILCMVDNAELNNFIEELYTPTC